MSTVYVVGGGLAGLAASVALAEKGRRVVLIEGAPQAGGRCRSYFDATLGLTIDNGNHLVLSGNTSVQKYLATIGAGDALAGPDRAVLDFIDVRDCKRWTLRPNDGLFAWWMLSDSRRVPDTAATDYLALLKLLLSGPSDRIQDRIACAGPLWERLLQPFLLAVLNTEPRTASAKLAANVIRESLALGGRAYRPRIAHPTLAAAFVDPALAYLKSKGADIRIGQRVRGLTISDRVTAFDLAGTPVDVGADDDVILAVPPWVATELLPGIDAPTEFRAIVNAHFRIVPPPGSPLITGVIGGAVEWVFAFEDRVSITVSGADAIVDDDREALARRFWADVAKTLRLPADPLPPWQVVKERRATFAATPEQAARRPGPRTPHANLRLAGDWTDTGLPSTIEGAIRSGQIAAGLV